MSSYVFNSSDMEMQWTVFQKPTPENCSELDELALEIDPLDTYTRDVCLYRSE